MFLVCVCVCMCVCAHTNDDAQIPPELSPLSSPRTTWGSPSLPSCCDIFSPGPTASPSPGRLACVLYFWGGSDEHQAKQIIRLLESAGITDFHFVHPVISFSFHFIYSIYLKRVKEKHKICKHASEKRQLHYNLSNHRMFKRT